MSRQTVQSEVSFTPRRGFAARVVYETLGRTGARLGMAWISLLVALAVAAPIIASSHPILMDIDGELTSPMLEHLTATDVTLIVGVLAALVLWPIRRFRHCRWLWIGGVAVTATVSWLTVTPPEAVVYSKYREALEKYREAPDQSHVRVLHTLVPYSPSDRLRDARTDTRTLGPGLHPTVQAITRAVGDVARDGIKRQFEEEVPEPFMRAAVDPLVANAFAAARQVRAGNTAINDLGRFDPDIDAATPSAEMIAIAKTQPRTRRHWMGTTINGEDLLSRMIHASRIALSIGFIATGIAVCVGVIIGGLMGYFSGWIDLLGMRLVEVFAAVPTIFMLIAIVAFYGRNLYLMMIVIGLTSWVGYALFVRAEFLRLRRQDFVQAAVACGLPLWSVLFRHMLPNGVSPVLVNASFGVAAAILTESTLSFLGLGLVEEPSWGQMLNQALRGGFHWWIALFPGMAIFLTVFGYNMVGEALRDAIDPHLKRASQL